MNQLKLLGISNFVGIGIGIWQNSDIGTSLLNTAGLIKYLVLSLVCDFVIGM